MDNKCMSFSDSTKFMFNADSVIIFNRLNGQWIKISRECYEILRNCMSEKLTEEEMLSRLADEEDRAYIRKMLDLLDSMGCMYRKTVQKVNNVSFAITHRCNLKCIHCMVNAQYGNEQTDYFDTETICRLLNKIVSVEPEVVVLTGGEPLLRKDFLDILSHLRSKYSGKITLMTNGTLFNSQNITPIIEKVNNIDISLDGADEESCSVIRGKGVFDRVVNNIDILKQKGFENISLSMVLSNNNLRYAQQFFELNRKLHTFPMLRALSYEGRAKDNKTLLENSLTTDRICQGSDTNSNIEQKCCCCTAGYDQITIEANGDIFPCNLFGSEEFKLGNITKIDNLMDILNANKGSFVCRAIEKYEPDKFLKCKECNINYLCWSCLYPMYSLSDDEFEERCKAKKQLLSNVWEE